jgi:tetratricopeptide (TPR) repeat protein
MSSRIDVFRKMIAKDPANLLAHYGLANEAIKDGLWEEARVHLETYLAGYDDEGNGYGRLALALESLGLTDEARAALRKGIESAQRFGHAGMAGELEERLESL